MKFRMFTSTDGGVKIAVDVDRVVWIEEYLGNTVIHKDVGDVIEVSEDFDTVFSRLNTIAE